ncbi:MAG: urea carboxylase-associated family protein [Proteobacteria bacterium]|jgi:uncharacterized protein|nr:urea carboxylase-associated family protein [Pseudomonadota bacterium]
MGRKLIEDIVVPAREARAVVVRKGQFLRIVDMEGEQVADIVFYNAERLTETYSMAHSVYLNMLQGTGDIRMVKTLWSSPPHEQVMMTVTDDPVACHCLALGTCCSSRVYDVLYGEPGHASCATSLARALAPHGVPANLPDVFNAFMPFDPERWYAGDPKFRSPPTQPGDYLELRAEIDVLVGVSACPSDRTPTNGFKPTPLRVQVFSG